LDNAAERANIDNELHPDVAPKPDKATDMSLRAFLAPNASPMTMEGTVTYVVGRRRAAIIDPGSDDPGHLDTLADAVSDAERVVVVATHYHPDHSTGAAELAERVGAALLGGRAGHATTAGPGSHRRAGAGGASESTTGEAERAAGGGLLADGVAIETDDGDLVVIRTPGHSPDHIALHWTSEAAVFCGDLMMGGLDTAVVAAPEGNLRDYMASLERIRSLRPAIIYPAHGPAFDDPDAAIDRYLQHRRDRLDQVRRALDDGIDEIADITDLIHGPGLDPTLRSFAEAAVEAYLEYLRTA
jgi:glyoxylase-like metal-dependent hydrolase (beta-lactamase superfamily II)